MVTTPVRRWIGAKTDMGSKFKVAGLLALGAVAGALATMQLAGDGAQLASRAADRGAPAARRRLRHGQERLRRAGRREEAHQRRHRRHGRRPRPALAVLRQEVLQGIPRSARPGRFVGIGIEIGMEDGLVKVVSPIEGSPAFRAGLKSGDLITKIDDTLVKGLTVDQAVKRMRGEPNTKVAADHLPQEREPHVPGQHHRARKSASRACAAKMIEPGYAWVRVSQFQDRTVDDFATKVEDLYKQDPNLKGLVLDLRNDPGGLLEGAIGDLGGVPAERRRSSSRPTARSPTRRRPSRPRPSTTSAAAAPTRCATCPPRSRRCRWSCSSTRARPRPAKSSPARCRTTTAPRSWARRRSARARCRPCAAARPTPALKITTARYYTPSGALDPGQGHRARRHGSTRPPRATVYAALRTREADLEKHLQSGQGAEEKDDAREKARDEARKKLEAELAKNRNRAAQAAARVRQRRRFPARAGAQPPEGQAGRWSARRRPSARPKTRRRN